MNQQALTFQKTKKQTDYNLLYEATVPYLRSYIYKNFKNVRSEIVSDVISETMIKVFLKIEQLDSNKAKYITWVTQIAKNECLYQIKQANKMKKDRYEDFANFPVSDSSMLEEKQEREDMYDEAIAQIYKLKEPFRYLMVEHYIKGLEQKQIAKNLKINYSTVKTRIRKAKHIVRSRMYDYEN